MKKIITIIFMFLIILVAVKAGGWGPAIEVGHDLCIDKIDNDNVDGIDSQDPKCGVWIHGYVINNVNKQAINGANVEARVGDYYKTAITDDTGFYSLVVVGGKDYTMMATAFSYSPSTIPLSVDYSEEKVLNFTLSKSSSTCEPDCTRGSANGNVCDRTCEGYNGCSFTLEDIKDVCDPGMGEMDGYQKGMVVPLNSGYNVRCCTGPLLIKPTGTLPNTLDVNSKNVVTISKVVILNGKPVTMRMIVFE